MFSFLYQSTSDKPNQNALTVFSLERRQFLFSHSNGDINSHEKILSCFCAKAHLVFLIGVYTIRMKYGHGELDTHHPKHATVYNVIYIKSLLIRVNVSIIHLVVIIKQTLLAKQGRP